MQGTFTHTWLEDFLGDGIFTVDGHQWREQRKLASHEFSTKILRDFSGLTFRKNAVRVGNIFLEAANRNQTVDINVKFFPFLIFFILTPKETSYGFVTTLICVHTGHIHESYGRFNI